MDGWTDRRVDGWMDGWMKYETKVHEKPKEGRIRAKGTERKKTKQNSIFINLNHNIMYL